MDPLPQAAQAKTRVAVPVDQRPSLIPIDVMQDAIRVEDEVLDEVGTSPLPVAGEPPFFTQSNADPELAIYALSQVGLFQGLSAESLAALTRGALQLEVPDGELLFLEGDEARSFYVVLDGTIELLRQRDGREVALRHANRGESLGILGLFSAQLRAASARAIGDCVIIEVPGERLQEALDRDERIHRRLLTMHRERLLESFMSSKLFNDIDSIARGRLIGRFVNRELEAGEQVVAPGEVSNLIAVVTHGVLLLEERGKAGQQANFYEVTPGQFVIVTCALSGTPARVRIQAPQFATASLLSHRDLNELLLDYPALRALPQRLVQLARAIEKNVFAGTIGVPGL